MGQWHTQAVLRKRSIYRVERAVIRRPALPGLLGVYLVYRVCVNGRRVHADEVDVGVWFRLSRFARGDLPMQDGGRPGG